MIKEKKMLSTCSYRAYPQNSSFSFDPPQLPSFACWRPESWRLSLCFAVLPVSFPSFQVNSPLDYFTIQTVWLYITLLWLRLLTGRMI